jgi:hypothetical protein
MFLRNLSSHIPNCTSQIIVIFTGIATRTSKLTRNDTLIHCDVYTTDIIINFQVHQRLYPEICQGNSDHQNLLHVKSINFLFSLTIHFQ